MGQYLLFLKPNISLPYKGSSVFTGTITGGSGNSLTLNADPGAIIAGYANTTCHWIAVTNGTYNGYHWRILTESTVTLTIDGIVPSTISTSNSGGAPSYAIYSSVPADCAWTDPSTISYFDIRPSGPIKTQKSNQINVKRFANAGWVVVNMKKIQNTVAFTDIYLGNYLVETQATQINKGLEYAYKLWPSTSPQYSNLYWYDNRGYRSTSRDIWDVGTSAFRMERGVLIQQTGGEILNNNMSLDQLALEVN